MAKDVQRIVARALADMRGGYVARSVPPSRYRHAYRVTLELLIQADAGGAAVSRAAEAVLRAGAVGRAIKAKLDGRADVRVGHAEVI